jgi:hypothetical protein
MQPGMLCQNASAGKSHPKVFNQTRHAMHIAFGIVLARFKGSKPGFQGGMQIPARRKGKGLFFPFFIKMPEFWEIGQKQPRDVMNILGPRKILRSCPVASQSKPRPFIHYGSVVFANGDKDALKL